MMQRALGGHLVVALGLALVMGLPGPVAAQTSSPEAQKAPERAGEKAQPGAERKTGSEKPISDAWLTAKTKLALMADEDVSGTSINVDTSNGVVTLKGKVESEAEKAKAVEIARKIEGVKQVQDQLAVAPRGDEKQTAQRPGQTGPSGAAAPAKRDAAQIAQQVRQQIRQTWTSGQLREDGDSLKGPDGTAIEVDVNDGIVTLEGKVRDVQDIVKVAEAARRVPGVRAVKTNIESGQQS
jgi:hyperosmotically inducible periplasmic protein